MVAMNNVRVERRMNPTMSHGIAGASDDLWRLDMCWVLLCAVYAA